jgi:hypothetical protein
LIGKTLHHENPEAGMRGILIVKGRRFRVSVPDFITSKKGIYQD